MALYCAIIWFGIAVGADLFAVAQGMGVPQIPAISKTNNAATVNGEIILLEEVDAAIEQRGTLQPPTASQLRQLRIETLTGIIDEKLIRQFLRDRGPKIDPAEIDKQWLALEAAQKARNKTIADYLRETNQTEMQLRDNMKMLLQLDRYVKEHTTPTDLKKYYEQNKAFFDKVTVRTSHIVIRVSPNTPMDERIKARKKLAELRADILAKKIDFAAAAKEHSQCPSAPQGGDIGYIFRKWQNVDELYARAAFSLKTGEISDVIETEFGIHIIKVTDRREGKPTAYEDCVEDVRDSYTEELRQALLSQLRKKAKVEITVP